MTDITTTINLDAEAGQLGEPIAPGMACPSCGDADDLEVQVLVTERWALAARDAERTERSTGTAVVTCGGCGDRFVGVLAADLA